MSNSPSRIAVFALLLGSAVLVTSGCHKRWKMKMKMMKMKMMMKGHHGGGHGKGKKIAGPAIKVFKHLWMAKHLLKLKGDQVDKLKALRKGFHKKMMMWHLQHKRIGARLKVEWLEDQPDGGKIQALVGQLSALAAEKMKEAVNLGLAIRAVLTTEQWHKVLLHGKPGKGHHGMGGWGRHGGKGMWGKHRGWRGGMRGWRHGMGRWGMGGMGRWGMGGMGGWGMGGMGGMRWGMGGMGMGGMGMGGWGMGGMGM